MTEKRYDVLDKLEPRGQSVTDGGIPCTARTCVTRLNRLTEENEQLKKQLNDIQNYINDTINENEEAMEWGKRNGADIGSIGFYTMTENKRYNIKPSKIIKDGFCIQDDEKEHFFPTTKDKSHLIMYEKALNEQDNRIKDCIVDEARDRYEALSINELVDRLNEQEETIKKQNQEILSCHDTLVTIEVLCDAVLNHDFEGVVSKVDFCNMLIEMDNKDLAFLKECFEAIRDNDLKTMTSLTLECKYGGDAE